uniref:Chromosome 9 open reading frame 116 n=1 Tax=Apteryx owenii TaxID=8824 RepID=A0A8B9PI53_APTOW
EARPCRRAQETPSAPPREPRTSDFYRVSDNLPARFNHPARFQGYRKKDPHPLYRTSNQTYGSKAPTVHEMPVLSSLFYPNFYTLGPCGMYRDNGLNTYLEKSHVTGPDNFITSSDRLNFHPSYNPSGPSHC